ncbi:MULTISPECIES: hypothetical protein [Bacillales]|jgi:hypothetical protein|uniref:hypothetical protein n=1 Tax=Brevibacillus TaxID=55080 RepID=UPI000E3A4D28|nr:MULTISPECIES: hypothetical protein [Bacillales]REK63006.1 MAG: hypothetical protein DF221_11350 [Brevibacillus sp.]MBR8658260.1 hypothetical protein [Brevibacillus sp. NL20B1]MDT3414706.1 hypothetical protein [Brevibacillus aydinogluensis]NNV01404.1 hypothetical protein [Brevibacillus sp. MCWH]UFJ61061.1 hypothetical protein IRT44_17750 [Anoxybacillus sediminis]
MDLDKRLRELAAAKRMAFQPSRADMERIERNIRERIGQKQGRFRRAAVSIAAVATACGAGAFLLTPVVMDWQRDAGGGRVPVVEPADPSVEEQFPFAEEFIRFLKSYTDLELTQIEPSPFADVFAATNQAVRLTTNQGKLDVVFFPNPGQAEKVEIDEDFSVPGHITLTFTGAELKTGFTPMKASGPTYVYAHDKLLLLTNKSGFLHSFQIKLFLHDVYRDVFESFGIDPEEYEFDRGIKQGKQASHLSEKAWKGLDAAWTQVAVNGKVGDIIPGLFLKHDGQEALIVYKSSDAVNHLYRYAWEEERGEWVLTAHGSKQGKTIRKRP